VVIRLLHELESPTPEKVREVCERFLLGVVVTKEEDDLLSFQFRKKMPENFDNPNSSDYRDPFLRYKCCEIEIVHPRNEWWLEIGKVLGES